MLKLIPEPHTLKTGKHLYPFYQLDNLILPQDHSPALLTAALTLADDFEKLTSKRLCFAKSAIPGKAIQLCLIPGKSCAESYSITAGAEGIILSSSGENGLFYAIQTLRQIINSGNGNFPELLIEDTPDFPARGFYHDVTRGAVPTFDSLCQLADKMAYYKLNQLQLYMEHTFAFASHPEIWAGSDPLTAEEIIKLDRYCKERFIELVPSLSTFGHCYMLLRSQRLKELNELDEDGSRLPFSFHDRMRHYTLNCSDARSLELLEEMLAEFIPLFSSKRFNICCDETFDLGKGKNAAAAAEKGTTVLYTEFLKKIIAIVNSYDKIAMFWGDIIAEQPDLIAELPPETIALEWDYSANAGIHDTASLSKITKNFYICPGTSVWYGWSAKIHTAQSNILNYSRKGLRLGASGLLNTNWGDFGNVNFFAHSIHGMLYGAAAAWNTASAEKLDNFHAALDSLEFNAPGFAQLWYDFAENTTLHWLNMELLVDPGTAAKSDQFHQRFMAMDTKELRRTICRLREIFEQITVKLAAAKKADPLAVPELLAGFEMSILMHCAGLAVLTGDRQEAYQTADGLRKMEKRISDLWHRRNKPSEYHRVKNAILMLADKLDELKK